MNRKVGVWRYFGEITNHESELESKCVRSEAKGQDAVNVRRTKKYFLGVPYRAVPRGGGLAILGQDRTSFMTETR